MPRFLMSIWLWLAFYIAVLVAIGAVTVYLRDRIVSDGPEAAKDQQSWEAWRQEAARQDGSHGPVQRAVPPSDEPPMRVLMRDHFGTILGASIIFPAIILGFLLIVLHGVLQQGSDGTPSELS